MKEAFYGRIAGVDKPVSRLFFGTAMGPLMSCGDGFMTLLDGAAQRGVTAFDCARSYGRAEESLGRWMASRKNREDVVVLSKCGDIRNGVVKVNRQVIEEQLAASLQTLQTAYIDIYLLHRDDPDTPVGEMVEALNAAKQAGKIHAFGVSNWTVERIRQANDYARANGLEGFTVSSPNYGLARQMADLWGGGCVTLSGPEHREDRAWYAAEKMPVIAYSSLGRGFFSGRFRAGDEEGARRVLDSFGQKGYLYPENMERLRRAEQLAAEKGLTVPDIALRYVFAGPMDVYAVVSTGNLARLEGNIRAALAPLSAEEAAFLEGV